MTEIWSDSYKQTGNYPNYPINVLLKITIQTRSIVMIVSCIFITYGCKDHYSREDDYLVYIRMKVVLGILLWVSTIEFEF